MHLSVGDNRLELVAFSDRSDQVARDDGVDDVLELREVGPRHGVARTIATSNLVPHDRHSGRDVVTVDLTQHPDTVCEPCRDDPGVGHVCDDVLLVDALHLSQLFEHVESSVDRVADGSQLTGTVEVTGDHILAEETEAEQDDEQHDEEVVRIGYDSHAAGGRQQRREGEDCTVRPLESFVFDRVVDDAGLSSCCIEVRHAHSFLRCPARGGG